MSDPSFNRTLSTVKGQYHAISANERDFWNSASTETRKRVLQEGLDLGTVNLPQFGETATENAYQQDYTARFNQIINTSYDSLPESVKASITESLIAQGGLPNPSRYTGIGKQYKVGDEVFIECDRCDESFAAMEDFEEHKNVDHGDDDSMLEDAENIFDASMNPDITEEALREARKAMTETDEGDLHRSVYFNGDKFPQPTIEEPDDVKGEKGYNDNPNEGLYDYKNFKRGTSQQRDEGLESKANENDEWYKVTGGPQFFDHVAVSDEGGTKFKCDSCGYIVTVAEGGAPTMKSHLETHGIVTEVFANEDGFWDDKNNFEVDVDKYIDTGDVEPLEGGAHDKADEESIQMPSYYEGEGDEPEYKDEDTISDITEVRKEKAKEVKIPALEVDFAPELIDYVYPTLKEKATEGEEGVDMMPDGYDDNYVEEDDEQITETITLRKLHGYSPYTIARELEIQYDIEPEEALEKVNSVEVSTNDKVAQTFFGKMYKECTEAEIDEMKAYSGESVRKDYE